MNYSFLKDELEQMMRTENMGSSLAIFLGILFIFNYISTSKAGPPQNPEHLFLGIMIIPGALVYRSAKKRKHEEAKNTKKRRITEWAVLSMILCFAILILVSTNGFAIERMPVLFFLAVPWILISYIVVIIKSPKLIK
jgi:cytochrome bd-type quinol oxidase subunit 2